MSTFDLLDPQNTYDDVMDRVREHSGAYGTVSYTHLTLPTKA